MTNQQPDKFDPTHRRLTSLEEAAMFQEQAAHDAREAAEEALRRILALERRIAGMEERLGNLVQDEPDMPADQKPPHSAG